MTREIEARLKISAVDRTGSVLKNIGNKLTDVNRRVDALNRAQNNALMAMGRYIGPAALAYGIKESITQFAELERRMTRIGITAGVSREQTQAATDELRRMAGQYAMSFDDVVKGLDTLVSSGLTLKEAMAFLPSVLKTAQATGSATEDIANTALKASSALKISAAEMDKAFDIMVAGGKAGQFELKDMAQYIPGLANSFATLGYQGEDGLKKLIALLQTVREDTGSSEEAVTNLSNIFQKIYTEDTANKFKKFGIDIRKEMQAATKSGEDAVSAFVRLSKEAIKGDLTKLPLLFTDAQYLKGMQSLITSPDSLKKFLDLLNSADVKGTVLRDLGTVLDDTKTKIDRLSNSWQDFYTKLGSASADVVGPGLDFGTKFLDDKMAETAGMKKFNANNAGMEDNAIEEFYRRSTAKKLPTNIVGSHYDNFQNAIRALGRGEITNVMDYIDRESMRTDSMGVLRAQYGQYRPGKGPANLLGASNATGNMPVPFRRPGRADALAEEYSRAGSLSDRFASGQVTNISNPFGSEIDQARKAQEQAAAKFLELGNSSDEAGQSIKQGGDEAGRALREGAAAMMQAARTLAGMQFNVGGGSKVNANVGRTDTFVRSPNTGHQ